MPIIEPEVSIKSPDKAGAEALLRDELTEGLDALPDGRKVMLKLTLPGRAGFYTPLIKHPARGARRGAVRRLYAGRRLQAPRRQSRHDRELLARADRGLTRSMSDAEFDAALATSIDEIYNASTAKV